MGSLPEHRYRAGLPDLDDDDALETGEVGSLGNVRETTALQVTLEDVPGTNSRVGPQALYLEEIAVEFGVWTRRLDHDPLDLHHAWSRHECHTKHDAIAAGDCLVVAELPFAGRRRYDRTTFRNAIRKHPVPHFAPAFIDGLREASVQRRGDLVDLALGMLEDDTILELDPFNTGRKRVAGISVPGRPFGEEPKGHARSGGKGEDGRTGWALGTCRDPSKVHRAVELGLYEKILLEAEKHAMSDGEPGMGGGRLRYAYPPSRVTKAERLRLTDDVPDAADKLAPHAAWLAMAGLGPTETMPASRSVAEVAFRRLNDLLYNLQRRVNRA
jgi:hypothetical protein